MEKQPSAKRKLGVWMSIALVIGNMVGSGVFLLPSSLASYGGISLLSWVFTSAGALMLALVFSRLGRAYPKTGGPYAYTRRAFGDFVGFQTAWGYWINAWVGNAAIAVAFVGYLAVFWGHVADSSILGAGVAIALIWVLTAVNVLGVRQAGWVQLLTTILKMMPLIAIGVVGIFMVDTSNFKPFNASGDSTFSAISSAGALTLWAFIGLESATVPADDVENPQRTIPLSTIVGTIVAAVVYILGTAAVMGVLPTDTLANSTAPFSDAAAEIFGGWASKPVAMGALISTLGCLNGWILLQGQVPAAVADDGLFPEVFARRSKNGTPYVGLVVSSVLITVLVITNYTKGLVDLFTWVILLATLTALVPYAYSAMAEVMLFVNERERFSIRNLTVDVLISLLAFGYSFWAIWGAGADVVMKGMLLFLAGVPLFVFIKWRAAVKESTVTQPAVAPVAPIAPQGAPRISTGHAAGQD